MHITPHTMAQWRHDYAYALQNGDHDLVDYYAQLLDAHEPHTTEYEKGRQ